MKKRYLLIPVIIGALGAGFYYYNYNQKKIIQEANEKILKFKKYYQVLNQWIRNNIEHYSLEQAILDRGYHNIAIYGYGEIGNRIYDDLKQSEKIKITCFIDKMAEKFTRYNEDGVPVYSINEAQEYSNVNVIIVTTVNIYKEIEQLLKELKLPCEIISFEDLIIRKEA